ncbi:hypothetical protein [Desulfosoma caldarium]|uniref:Uncharacterized protein n=1 Tax=Desulfosoma caldarium TaxID=610254 RepID=A0A3N1VQC2_9BACT|nr:hypothetical protein [Desulfosoma caldarium]ROR03261.1 hypothetical protein EDC27_0526 [Desulfosoma caldarium]
MNVQDVGSALNRGLAILDQIQREYPKGEFDREMLHGDMDFRYRRIHELRRLLDALPTEVRRFATFAHALPYEKAMVVRVLRLLQEDPAVFRGASAKDPQALKAVAEEVAQKIAGQLSEVVQIISRMRLAGILTATWEISEPYRPVVAAYVSGAESAEGSRLDDGGACRESA